MRKHQHKPMQVVAILLLLASLAGCSSSGTLRSDYDPSADFGAYKTWNFMDGAGPDYVGYESLFTQYMRNDIHLTTVNHPVSEVEARETQAEFPGNPTARKALNF